ncbi:MAG: glycosyltransferase family 4 protein [Bacteroidales bacterium]|nr:glycosyltransferase family 4 protein [Bacteroidales bacterium]
MKILQLCYKPPFPSVDGGTLAMNSLTRGLLAQGCEVKILSVASEKHPVKWERLTEEYKASTGFEAVEIDLRVKALPAAVALLCGESYNVKRFDSSAFRSRLTELLKAEKYDVIHVESIFLAPYLETIRQYSQAPVVLRAHNVEHRIWQQMAEGSDKVLKRWYLKKLALALRAYEVERVNAFDGVACITEDDMETFRLLGCRKPMISIPFGMELPQTSATKTRHDMLFYIGSMDWRPNLEGVTWFLDNVWPLIHKEMPELRMVLAGRNTPDDLVWRYWNREDVEIRGEVENASTFISEGLINVVPLLSGSGIRVKIIEAMSHGKAVVSTTIGAQGIHYEEGKHLLIANTPEEFVEKVRRLANDPAFAVEMGNNARELIAAEYDANNLAKRLIDFYTTLQDRKA